jgi:ubiquinol-cytochrome c reductase cytochrome b subunit
LHLSPYFVFLKMFWDFRNFNYSYDSKYSNPWTIFFDRHLLLYSVKVHLNNFYNFGFLTGIAIIFQILTGLFLAIHYVPDINLAFISVEVIMRDVNYGWLFRNLHSNGASLIFFCMYVHIARGLHLPTRKEVWFSGSLLYILTMAVAFLGYVLPWGQMSYWGATVICNLFSVLPFIGDNIVTLLWGNTTIANATLYRFYVIHFMLPFIIIVLSSIHMGLLHKVGSSAPEVDAHEAVSSLPMDPFFLLKDTTMLLLLLNLYVFLVFFILNY